MPIWTKSSHQSWISTRQICNNKNTFQKNKMRKCLYPRPIQAVIIIFSILVVFFTQEVKIVKARNDNSEI